MQPIHANFMSLVLKLYIYMYVCVHTLFLHAVVHVDESSSVFPLVHQEISSVFLICLIILLKGFDQFWSVYHKKCFPPISSFCCLVHQLSQVFPIYFSSWSLYFVFSSLKFVVFKATRQPGNPAHSGVKPPYFRLYTPYATLDTSQSTFRTPYPTTFFTLHRRPGNPATRQPGDPATRQPGNPAHSGVKPPYFRLYTPFATLDTSQSTFRTPYPTTFFTLHRRPGNPATRQPGNPAT